MKEEILTEEQWRENRKHGIGCSELLPILTGDGRLRLYYIKTGELEDDFDPTVAMELGHVLEPYLSDKTAEITGWAINDPGDFTIRRHEQLPFFFYTPDRDAVNQDIDEVGDLELKTAGEWAALQWGKDQLPLYYEVQLQGQLSISGRSFGAITSLIGNRKIAVHERWPLDRLHVQIWRKVEEFWNRVERRDPPEADAASLDALESVFSDEETVTIELPEGLARTIRLLDKQKAAVKKLQGSDGRGGLIGQHKARIIQALGNATEGILGDARFTFTNRRTSNPAIKITAPKGTLEEEQKALEAALSEITLCVEESNLMVDIGVSTGSEKRVLLGPKPLKKGK